MLMSLEAFRTAIGAACTAYRQLVPLRAGDISRLE